MNPTTLAQVVLFGYALLLIFGGFLGYRKAGSRPSLIAGCLSGTVALLAATLAFLDPRALWLGVALAAAMVVVFLIRLARTRKFMPSGLLLGASLGILMGLLVMMI